MSAEVLERQRAFTALLRTPVIDRARAPETWPLVRKHRTALTDWFSSRLGYRLVVTDSAARLFRLPLAGEVIAPKRFQPSSRRVLVLAVLAAAAAEDAEDVTTTQDLSDRVRVLSAHEDVRLARYDPDRFAERLLFIKAIQTLVTVGALAPTGTDDEQRREVWAHHQDQVGGAYEVRRDLLLRMVDPVALRVAVSKPDPDEPLPDGAARCGLMRKLLELPVCLTDDLSPAERVYLASQRHRVLAWCAEMTGWTAEQRNEGIAMIAVDEADTDLPFPRLRAVDFISLMVLDELLRCGRAELTDDDIAIAAAEVRLRHAKALTNELRPQGAVESAAVDLLGALDLLRRKETGWWLTPAAARFRNPKVISVTARLGEDAPDE